MRRLLQTAQVVIKKPLLHVREGWKANGGCFVPSVRNNLSIRQANEGLQFGKRVDGGAKLDTNPFLFKIGRNNPSICEGLLPHVVLTADEENQSILCLGQ
ncbi:hypothetical protein [Alicyclobacillus acidocaldarius]|uniref:hypothetical protein n=1 Tax=Alicyclobacillus acidocaldarius TaxID=405212 RepID=UPI0011D2479B|nr:hypothetical protein [Alicyclobacillus acidocaldarius]